MTEAANFFDEVAAAQTPAPVKRRLDRDLARAMTKRDAEKALDDEGRQVAAYGRWRRAQKDALLAGPHGKEVRGLVQFMRTMTLSSAPALLGIVERATFWQSMSVDDRFVLLGIINAGISVCRVKAGLEPFDDPLPWCEEPKAYQRLHTMFGLDGR